MVHIICWFTYSSLCEQIKTGGRDLTFAELADQIRTEQNRTEQDSYGTFIKQLLNSYSTEQCFRTEQAGFAYQSHGEQNSYSTVF